MCLCKRMGMCLCKHMHRCRRKREHPYAFLAYVGQGGVRTII